MPKSYFTNVLPANILIKSKQSAIRSTNNIQHSVDYNQHYCIIDQNESSMYKAQINCKVTIMGLLFNFLRRPVQVRNAFFILFCLFSNAGAVAQIIVPPITFIKAPSTTTITSSVNPSIGGQPVLLTATITSSAQGTPTGTVHFYDNATNTDLTPAGVTISSGIATFTTAILTDNASFKATYSGDSAFLPSTSVAFAQSINYPFITITPNFFTTTTTLVSNLNPSVAGSQPVTFTATVTSSGGVNVTGIVEFWDNTNNTNLTPGGVTLTNGIAAFTTSSLPFGDLNITAVYRGDTNGNQQSTSNTVVQRVQLNITGIGVSLSVNLDKSTSSTPGTTNWGDRITFTATVSTGIGAPSGTVVFANNGFFLGSATMDAAGNAALTTNLLTPGSHNITASYFSITSNVLTHNVTPPYPPLPFGSPGAGLVPANVALIHNVGYNVISQNEKRFFFGDPSPYGKPITFAAHVSGLAGYTPTGSVLFQLLRNFNRYDLGEVGLDEAGDALFTTSILPVGRDTIRVIYSGNDVYEPFFDVVIVEVEAASTTTTLSSNRNPAVAGQQITFTAQVAPPYPESNAFVPGGTVIFNIDGVDQAPAPLSGNGIKAFLDISSLAPGNHTIKEHYPGDANYKGSNSATITQVIEPVGSAILYFLGDSQSTPVNTVFLNSLLFDIININPKLVGGASVTFTAPASGASGTFSNGTNSITIKTTPLGSVGVANSGPFTANGIAGTYTVTATIPGFGTATFKMTNTAICDPEALTFTGSYADVTLGCNPANPDASLGTATATDANGAVIVTSTDGPVVSDGCNRSKTRTFTASDGCNNTATTSRTVRWIEDVTPPAFTGSYADLDLGLNPANPTASLGIATATDACGTVMISSQDGPVVSNGCNRSITRTFTAKDGCNNTSTVSRKVIWISDVTPPTVLTKNITAQLTPAGSVTITASQIDNGSFDVCGIQTLSLSKSTFICSDVGANTVRLTAADANGNTSSANATVTVEDHVAPTMFTKNITVQLTAAGNVSIMPAQVNNGSFDACGIQSYSLSKSTFLCSDVGANTVKLTATDANGNTATANATVTVEDHIAPTMSTKNITVQLTAAGNVTITAAQVDNGCFDICGIETFSLSKSTFLCSDVGANTVRLTATDANGNTASANVTVTVEDHIAPTMITKNITVQLTAAGNVTITAAQVNNGSFDACGIQTLSLSKTTFLCSNVGPNTVTLTATDANGNTASANATVTVEDHVAPTMLTKNITVQLTAGGNVVITPAQVNNGSFDACGIQTLSLSKSTFLCSDIGANTVTLTATDANGNTASANATVTVQDHVTPTMLTRNITVQLTAAGNVTITAAQVDNGSFDACGIQSYSLSKSTFLCSDVGANTVTLTATDANGNTATASAVVTVEDKIKPVITYCPTIPVLCYNANGTYTIPALIATDNCSVQSVSYDVSGATSRSGNGSNASGAFNPGINTIAWKVTDVNGNTSTCTTTVKVDRVDVTIADVYASGINSSIGSPNTIYVGFGGSSVTLTAQVSSSLSPNSYTYKWTTGSPGGPAFATTQSVTVSPSSTTTYFVSIKDVNNCSQTTQVSKQISVVDIRCGTNKIIVCQFKNGSYSTICVSSSPKTINNLTAGSYLGACVQTVATKAGQVDKTAEVVDEHLKDIVMPNPSTTNFRIVLGSNDLKEPVKLIVTDMMGRVVETRTTNAGQVITIGDKYRSGIYVVTIIQGKKSRQLKLIKLPD